MNGEKAYTVWVDQNDCTGCGQCAEDAPEMFFMWNGDGLAYAKRIGDKTGLVDGVPRLKGESGQVVIPDRLMDLVVEIVEDCPGSCLWIEEKVC